jgi:hypothetical protein
MHPSLTFKSCLAALGIVIAAQTGVQAQTFTPIPLTPNSFTYCMVVPSNWPCRLNAQAVTCTLDEGPTLGAINNSGFPVYYTVNWADALFEQGLYVANTNYGMPTSGSTFTNLTMNAGTNAHVYKVPAWTNYGSNCLLLGPYTNADTYNGLSLTEGPYVGKSYTNGSLTLYTPGVPGQVNTNYYDALSFLCTASSGPLDATLKIYYASGTSQSISSFGMPDWFNNTTGTNTSVTPTATLAWQCNARFNPAENANEFDNVGTTTGSRLWSVDVSLSTTNSAVTNITFTYKSGGGSGAIFALSGSTNKTDTKKSSNNSTPLTGPFWPIPISGFNAGCVVANAAYTPAGMAPLTATMDQGTNLGGSSGPADTFFEQGYDAAAPTNGFPAHGSTITSASNPDATYQMASNYYAPMAVLIDANHTRANITPANTKVSYSAFSLLTAGGAIGTPGVMTNYIILEHADGVNESNLFYGYDWFNNTIPYAWDANERINFSTGNGREVSSLDSGDPLLFESQFGTADGTPVTNIVLGYLTAPETFSTTFIVAVSASTNFFPLQLSTYTPAQNVYAGNSAVFSVALSFGNLPSYQWQYINNGTTNDLEDGATGTGSTIYGATSATLTVSNVSSADVGYYMCSIVNAAPSSTQSPPVPLTLLVSTGMLITQPGDAITDFYNTIGTAVPYPASGMGAANIIDGTLSPYLNYGAYSAGSYFAGPVGYVVTPSLGNSIVTAARIYVSTNLQADDPADFTLYGSSDGVNWSLINYTPLALPFSRNLSASATINSNNQVLEEIDFPNTQGYNMYAVYFTNTVAAGDAYNGLEFAEVQLLGSLTPQAPEIVRQPAPPLQNLQQGGSVTWTLLANGAGPITYQWYQGSINTPIAGATNASYGLSGVTQSSSGASYFCVASNPYGSTNSVTVTLNVLTNVTSTYESTVLADQPIAFLRLDEGTNNPPNDGVVANDLIAGHDGVYSNTVLRLAGYSPFDTDDYAAGFGQLTDPSVNAVENNYVAGISGINFGTAANGGTNFSVEAWVNLAGNSINGAGIVTKGWGLAEQFALDTGGNNNAFRFYFREASGTSLDVSPNVAPALSSWYHLVGVVNESSNVECLYVNGLLAGSNSLSSGLGVLNRTNPVVIGSRQSSETTAYDLQLDGSVANVAIYNYALSGSQVSSHYLAAGVAPSFVTVPTSITVTSAISGSCAPVEFSASAYGTGPLAYQWRLNGANLTDGPSPSGSGATISGSATATLTISGATIADNGGSYDVVVTNNYGAITSSAATLTVVENALFGTVEFTLDTNRSSLAISGSLAISSGTGAGTYSFTQQGSGSLTTHYGGDIYAHLTSTNVAFPGGSLIQAQTNGTWEPAVGGGAAGSPGSAVADYGIEASDSIIFTAYFAARNIQVDLASPVVSLANGSFNAGALAFTYLTNSTGTPNIDYNVSVPLDSSDDSEGNALLTGSATNGQSTAYLTNSAGMLTLVIPVNFTNVWLVSGDTVTDVLKGTLFATTSPTNWPLPLSVSTQTGQMSLTWPSFPGPTYTVQTTTNLDSPWVTASGSTTVEANTTTWTCDPTNQAQFYRLKASY